MADGFDNLPGGCAGDELSALQSELRQIELEITMTGRKIEAARVRRQIIERRRELDAAKERLARLDRLANCPDKAEGS